jgi:hypothetical protein
VARWRWMISSAAVAAVVAAAALTAPVSAQPDSRAFTFAVIGDIPYGDAQIARFPAVVDHTPAPNLTRITVDGSTKVDNYLRVTVNPSGPRVLTWVKVPFTAP